MGLLQKIDSDNYINLWKMTFQTSDGKGNQFLDLMDDNLETIKLSYTKGSPLSRSLMVDFIFIFSFHFILFFLFFFFYSIFKTTWVRVYQSCCHISHKTDHKTWENRVEGSGIK